jgi:hypothetical protein
VASATYLSISAFPKTNRRVLSGKGFNKPRATRRKIVLVDRPSFLAVSVVLYAILSCLVSDTLSK